MPHIDRKMFDDYFLCLDKKFEGYSVVFYWKSKSNHETELFSRSEKADATALFEKFPSIYEIARKLDFKLDDRFFRNSLGYGRAINIDLAMGLSLEDFENRLKAFLNEEYSLLKRQFDEGLNSGVDDLRYVEHLAKPIAEIKAILIRNGYFVE